MRYIVVLLFITGSYTLFAQQEEYSLPPYEISGYVKDVQTVFIPDATPEYWLTDNAIHNRLKFKYYPTNWLTIDAQARNRFMYGDFVKMVPNYAKMAQTGNYYANLDWIWLNDSSAAGMSELDRLNAQFMFGDWEITLGRQRVNWGINLVWNPNDIFNTFSYFDTEYEERPGTDAVSVKYYTSLTSSAQVIYKAGDSLQQMAMAGLYRFNKWEYDFQFLGGFMGNDYVLGAGYTGSIGGAAFRGEGTMFHPRKNLEDTSSVWVVSISGDYTFPNTLYLHGGVLFNSNGKSGKPGNMDLFSHQQLSPKTLSRGKFNVFGQLAYNITPLIKGNFTVIMNPDDLSSFISPSIDVSVSDNFSVSGFGQLFFGEKDTEFGKIGRVAYLRFKYSF